MFARLLPAVLLLTLAGCGALRFSDVKTELDVSPESVDLGTVWIGTGRHASLTLTNGSRAKLTVHISATTPLETSGSLELEGGASVDLPLFANPSEEGAFTATVTVDADDITRTVQLTGTAKRPPECAPSNDCQQSHFDAEQGACVEAALPDDSACGAAANSCVTGGVCRGGACVGVPKSCDDGDLCTSDACVLGQGCVHFDDSARCSDTNDPCQAGFCDPKTGCNSAEAPDGTRCGEADCTTAHVCIAGACVERSVPDGTSCNGDSPCQGAGICQQGSCVQPAATQLAPSWSYHPVVHLEFFGVLDALDQSYLLDCNGGCSLVSLTKTGTVRYRVILSSLSIEGQGMLLSGGNIVVAFQNGEVESRRASDGALVFATNLLPVLEPHFFPLTTQPATRDMLQINQLGSDGAGHLYVAASAWSYSGDVSENRGAFVVAMDPFTGAMQWHRRAWSLSNPVIDDAGRVLFTETPTQSDGNYLVALSGSGNELYRFPTQDGAPIAASGGRLVTGTGEVKRSDTGAALSHIPSWGWLDSVLLHGASAWAVTSGDIAPSTSVTRVDTDTGSTRWGTGIAPAGYGWNSAIALTADDAMLLQGTDNNGVVLHELDAFGNKTFTCELDAGDSMTHTALGNELLVAQSWTECPTCLRDPGEVLLGFNLPRRRPATSGWTAANGSAQRMNRPK
ncbi:MAG: hypothetical protein ACJ790_15320 [Myxococcaceae bacterium]